MVVVPVNFVIGLFLGIILGLMLYPFLIETVCQKPDIRIISPTSIVLHHKIALEKVEEVKNEGRN